MQIKSGLAMDRINRRMDKNQTVGKTKNWRYFTGIFHCRIKKTKKQD